MFAIANLPRALSVDMLGASFFLNSGGLLTLTALGLGFLVYLSYRDKFARANICSGPEAFKVMNCMYMYVYLHII